MIFRNPNFHVLTICLFAVLIQLKLMGVLNLTASIDVPKRQCEMKWIQ